MADDDTTRRESTACVQEEFGQAIQQLVVGWKVLGRFTLQSPLGCGAGSAVWRAHDDLLDEAVALKFVAAIVAGDAVAVNDLRQGTARARGLFHPHIVRVNDFMRDNTLATVSMEYVEGMTLEQRRLGQSNGVLSATMLAPLMEQICSALDYAHKSSGFVHRGLRPSNILVTKDGVAKIADFGVGSCLTEARLRLTGQPAGVRGAMLYMSPQQLDGAPPSPADDIYSLGAILYEMFAGEPPFSTGDLPAQIRTQEPPTIAARRAGSGVAAEPVPAAWKKTISACLAKDPSRRPTSGEEILSLLGLSGGKPEMAESAPDADSSKRNNPMPESDAELAPQVLPGWLSTKPPAPEAQALPGSKVGEEPVEAPKSMSADQAGEPRDPEAVQAPVRLVLPRAAVVPAPVEQAAGIEKIELPRTSEPDSTPTIPPDVLPAPEPVFVVKAPEIATPAAQEVSPDGAMQASSVPVASQVASPPAPTPPLKKLCPPKKRSVIHYPSPKEAQEEYDEIAARSGVDGGRKRSLIGRMWTGFLRY